MAKIPRFQQNQRLSPNGPSQAYDPNEARKEGENIATLGKEIQSFGVKLDSYRSAKKNADDTIFAKEWKDRADQRAQDAERAIKENKTEALFGRENMVSPNGENMTVLYDDAFHDMYDEISAIEDPRRRQIAKNAVGLARNTYRGQISDAEVAVHNAWMFEGASKSNKEMGVIIAKDPNLAQSKLAEQTSYLNSLPLGPENKLKMIKEAEDIAALSVINHYQEKKDYKSAEEAIKGPLAGFFDQKERQQLLNKNEQEYRQSKNEEWSDHERGRTIKKERKEDERLDSLSTFYKGVNSGDPIKRDQTLALAKIQVGVTIEQADYDNLKKTDQDTDYMNSDEISVQYTSQLVRREGLDDSFITRVQNEDGLKPSDKEQLINAYGTYRNARSKDPLQAKKLSQAQQFIDQAFKPERMDVVTGDDRINFGYQNKATMLYMKKVADGMDPWTAATQAISKVDPDNATLAAFRAKGTMSETTRNVGTVKRDIFNLKKDYLLKKSENKLTPEYMRKSAEKMRKLQKEQLSFAKEKAINDALRNQEKENGQ